MTNLGLSICKNKILSGDNDFLYVQTCVIAWKLHIVINVV